MEINIQEDRKLVEIWMSNTEKNDPAVRDSLKPLYAEYKKKKYLVAVYESGNKPLYQSTLDLIAHNKKRIAELAVQKEKRQRTSSLER